MSRLESSTRDVAQQAELGYVVLESVRFEGLASLRALMGARQGILQKLVDKIYENFNSYKVRARVPPAPRCLTDLYSS